MVHLQCSQLPIINLWPRRCTVILLTSSSLVGCPTRLLLFLEDAQSSYWHPLPQCLSVILWEAIRTQTWNLSKIIHRRIFRLKILHRQFHLILNVLVRKKKWVKMEKFTPLAKILHCRRQWRHWKIPPLFAQLWRSQLLNIMYWKCSGRGVWVYFEQQTFSSAHIYNQ